MRVLLSLVLSAICLTTVWCIKCYECDSLNDPRCNEYFCGRGVKEVDCDESTMPQYLKQLGLRIEPTGCVTKIHEGVGGQRFFIRRSCYFGDVENTKQSCEAEDPYVPYADILDCHVCTEDLCNTDDGHRNLPSMLTAAVFGLAFTLTRF